MTFTNAGHAQRFSDRFYVSDVLTPEYISAIYLLTSYGDLWQCAKAGVTTTKIDFSKITLQGMRTKTYIIYSAAKDIYLDTDRLTFYDMFDRRNMNETTLMLILNALRIKRTGYKDWLTAEKWEYAQK